MTRRFLTLPFTLLLLVACSTSKPASEPTIVGAVDEAVLQGTIEGEAAAEKGRVLGRVAGIMAAVLGGPEKGETIGETIDRYHRTREAVEITAAAIGTTNGAVEGARRGYELDLQFAELHKLEGLEVTRPWPDQIDARFTTAPSDELLAGIAAVFANREERAIQIEAAGEAALDVREALIQLGVPASSFDVQRNDELEDVVLRIRYAA